MHKFLVATVISFATLLASHSFAEEHTYECKTSKHFIIISKGAGDVYEYKAWNSANKNSDKPDVDIIQKNAAKFEGTGPCAKTYYSFKKGDVEYFISDSVSCLPGHPPKEAKGQLIVKINSVQKDSFWCVK